MRLQSTGAVPVQNAPLLISQPLQSKSVYYDSLIWDITHSYVTWRIHVRVCRTQLQPVWYSFIRVKTHSYETGLVDMRHDSFIYHMTHTCPCFPPTIAPSRKCIHTRYDLLIWDMSHSYETCLIHMRHDSFVYPVTHTCPCLPLTIAANHKGNSQTSAR